jgi:hypothetical protein
VYARDLFHTKAEPLYNEARILLLTKPITNLSLAVITLVNALRVHVSIDGDFIYPTTVKGKAIDTVGIGFHALAITVVPSVVDAGLATIASSTIVTAPHTVRLYGVFVTMSWLKA